MTNLNKRIFTSLIVFPVSMFFIIKGGNYIVSFLYAILILANFEAFSAPFNFVPSAPLRSERFEPSVANLSSNPIVLLFKVINYFHL